MALNRTNFRIQQGLGWKLSERKNGVRRFVICVSRSYFVAAPIHRHQSIIVYEFCATRRELNLDDLSKEFPSRVNRQVTGSILRFWNGLPDFRCQGLQKRFET